MSPTSYQTAPPRISIINNGWKAVKLVAATAVVQAYELNSPKIP